MLRDLRVLVIEDDRVIARLLEIELTHRGMAVQVCHNGLDGIARAEQRRHDVILLDIMLPGMDGERILAKLRRAGIHTPVIMLTARDADRDKIRNLDTGADDYLTKPFNIDELLARMRAVLRRTGSDPVLRAGSLEVNTGTREVFRGDRAIDLTAREFDLLALLAHNARAVVPRSRILERVWGDRPDIDPNVLDVYIGYLRRKLEAPGEPRLIHTVRGVGYALRDDPA
jgi:DNA-binding response OmpR family regulator